MKRFLPPASSVELPVSPGSRIDCPEPDADQLLFVTGTFRVNGAVIPPAAGGEMIL